MNRLILRLFLPALALVALAGCTELNYAAGPEKPVLANRALQQPHHITSQFTEMGHRVYLFWGLMPVGGDDGVNLIGHRTGLGDGIVNLTMKERYSLLDQLATLATLGIVSVRTLEVRGDIFAYDPVAPGATIIVPPGTGTVVVPPAGSVVVPPGSGTVVVPPALPPPPGFGP